MPIQLTDVDDTNVLTIRVSGMLEREDYTAFVPEFERLVHKHGKLRVLFDMTGLHGWTAGAAWEDLKFDFAHMSDIERLAGIGEKKWQQVAVLLFKPFIHATTRYFDHAASDEALAWLRQA